MARRPTKARKNGTYVEMEGQDDLRKVFATLNIAALRECKAVIAESSAEIEREAKARVPVASGKTQRSIKTILRDFGMNATIGSGYFLARFIEQGTRHQPARPFMNPAFQIVRPRFIARLQRALGIAVKEAA